VRVSETQTTLSPAASLSTSPSLSPLLWISLPLIRPHPLSPSSAPTSIFRHRSRPCLLSRSCQIQNVGGPKELSFLLSPPTGNGICLLNTWFSCRLVTNSSSISTHRFLLQISSHVSFNLSDLISYLYSPFLWWYRTKSLTSLFLCDGEHCWKP